MAEFDQIFANDPNNPQNVAENGVISIYAPGTRTLLPLKTVTGGPLANPLQLNSRGFGPAFIADGYTLVAWEAVAPGEVFQGTFKSYEGVLERAVAAETAAQTAAETAGTAAVAVVEQKLAAGDFKGDPGKDGATVLPTAAAIKQAVDDPASEARASVRSAVGLAFGVTFATDPAWGVRPDANTSSSTDNAPRLQSILNYAASNYAVTGAGLTIVFPPGDYGFSASANLPIGTPITLEGQGTNPVGSTGVSGTRFRRRGAFTGPIIRGVGTSGGYDPSGRIHINLRRIEFNGTSRNGTLVELARVSDSRIEHCRFFNNLGIGLRASEWFNSHISFNYFHALGTGRALPAVLLDSPGPQVTAGAGGNTVHMIGNEWEANTGTDLRITSNDATYVTGADWTLAVLMTNSKFERNVGDYPILDLDRVGDFHMSDSFMHLGPECTGSHIEIKGTAVQPSRPIKISNTSISGSKWNGTAVSGYAAVPYFIDMTAGELLLSNVSMNGDPATAFIHVGAGVARDAVRLSNVPVTNRAKLLSDERPFSTLNLGSAEVPARYVHNGTAFVTPTLTAEQVVYRMVQGIRTDWAGNVTIPSDAAIGRPIRVRVRWYSPAVAGNVRLEARAKPGLEGGSNIASTAELQAVVATVPATANQMVQTTFNFAATASPGQVVPILFSRNAGNAADTLTDNDIRVYQVELRYERAF